jgi:hypothetical protein
MEGTLFSNSNGRQRAVSQLAGAVEPGLLGSLGLGNPMGQSRNGQIAPKQANQVSPAIAQQLAEHAERQDPTIVDRASEFYSQHPMLVKALGAGALAIVMSHMSRR